MDMLVLEKEIYETPIKGVSIVSDNLIEIVGEQIVVIDGEIKEQFIYNIVGYEPKNGKPFISLKDNIVLI
jgi:hypothetical protein